MKPRTAALGIAALGLIAAAVLTTAWWPRHATQRDDPQARLYLPSSACLLTDSRGVTPGGSGAPVWAAMQNSSLSTHVPVTYLPAAPADVPIMINTLIERRCDLIIATASAAGPVLAAARQHPQQRFLVIAASSATAAASNAAIVAAAQAPGRIDQALHAVAAHTRASGS